MMSYGNLTGQIGVIDHGVFSVEGEAFFCWAVSHAVKGPHKIQMPCGTAEFSVRDHGITGFFLLGNQVPDGRILSSRQIAAGDAARFIISSGFPQRFRSEKTSYIIIAKWDMCICHKISSFLVCVVSQASGRTACPGLCDGISIKEGNGFVK